MEGWAVLSLILNIIWGVIIGYTIAMIWRMNSRINKISSLQDLMAVRDILESEVAEIKKPAKKKTTKKTTKKSTKKGDK